MHIVRMTIHSKMYKILMKILLTGRAGFIGSAVVRHIIRDTYDALINLDKLTYVGKLESLADVAVDIRKNSPTFGQWVGVHLSGDNKRQLWIPEGFAHGFMTLSDTAEFLYKTTNYYAPESDRGIRWNDETIGITWPEIDTEILTSAKDSVAKSFPDAEYF